MGGWHGIQTNTTIHSPPFWSGRATALATVGVGCGVQSEKDAYFSTHVKLTSDVWHSSLGPDTTNGTAIYAKHQWVVLSPRRHIWQSHEVFGHGIHSRVIDHMAPGSRKAHRGRPRVGTRHSGSGVHNPGVKATHRERPPRGVGQTWQDHRNGQEAPLEYHALLNT